MAWLRTDPQEEFLGALEHAAHSAQCLGSSLHNVRWLVISLHLALQGALVLALKRHCVSLTSIADDRYLEALRKWESTKDGKEPNYALASLDALLSRAANPAFLPAPDTVIVSDTDKARLKTLSHLRNEFVHFGLDGWSVELSGLRAIIQTAADVIERACTSDLVTSRMPNQAVDRLADSLATLRHIQDIDQIVGALA